MSFILKLFAFFGIVFAYFAYSPHLLDFNPKVSTTREWKELTGPLEVNTRLSDGERLFEGTIQGPESLAAFQGDIYTGTLDGCITKITGNKLSCAVNLNKLCEKEKKLPCSRPLGLRFDSTGNLYVADTQLGLLQVDVKKGTAKILLSAEEKLEGKKITFLDDLDLDESGNIYMSDASTKWDYHHAIYIFLEHENTGRIIKYNLQSKKASVLLDGLCFPNGVQISKKKDSLLIAETINDRVLRYYLKGAKAGQLEVLAELPGCVDNIRPSKNGYWVAVNNFKNASSPSWIERLRHYPTVKKAGVRYIHSINKLLSYASGFYPSLNLQKYQFLKGLHLDNNHGLAVEIDEGGKILQSVHSPDGKVSSLSELLEHNGYLYAGSYINSLLVKMKQK